MTLNLNVPKREMEHLQPRITVIGVGGAGGNAVSNMIQSNLEGVEFLVCNTDAQAMSQSLCERRLQLGRDITQGLGAGSRPEVGRAAAEEAIDEIMSHLEGANMVFITAGMGGGTGTGAAPVIARAAREKGILTVGVVTKPFHFEGVHRMRLAENGLNALQEYVDTLIIIPNQNLFRIANEKTTFADAFKMADDVLHSGVRGVTDLMVMPGLINLDFADIRSVMTEMGKAMMGTGEASGDNRAVDAAEAAISNPLLDDVSMKGARGVLINITGGPDLTLFEVDEAANRIRDEVDPDANIIFGSTFDASLDGVMRISVVATGIDAEASERPKPVTLSLISEPQAQAKTQAQQPGVAAAQPAASASIPANPFAMTGEADRGRQEGDATAAALQAGQRGQTEIQPEPEVQQQPEEDAVAETEADAVASDREEAFIAPPPVQPRATSQDESARIAARTEAQRPDPFAAAALANASHGETTKPRSRAGALFARVTGAARAIQGGQSEPTPNRHTAEPRLSRPEGAESRAAARPAEPRRAAPPAGAQQNQAHSDQAHSNQARPAAGPRPMPQPERAPEPRVAMQTHLSGLDPVDRLSDRQAEEDQLDIPAFLRRQAN